MGVQSLSLHRVVAVPRTEVILHTLLVATEPLLFLVDLILKAVDSRPVLGDQATHELGVLVRDRVGVIERLVLLEHRIDGGALLGLGGALGCTQVHELLLVHRNSHVDRQVEVGVDCVSLEVPGAVIPSRNFP